MALIFLRLAISLEPNPREVTAMAVDLLITHRSINHSRVEAIYSRHYHHYVNCNKISQNTHISQMIS